MLTRAMLVVLLAVTVILPASTGVDATDEAVEVWISRQAGAGAEAVTLAPGGRVVFVTGPTVGAEESDLRTVAYRARTGVRLWGARYDGPAGGRDTPSGIVASPDGAMVFVTGTSLGEGTDQDMVTVAYDASIGSRAWVQRFDGRLHSSDGASAIGVSPDGSTVFVTGASQGRHKADFATIAYDASSGVRLWVARHDGPAGSEDVPTSLVVHPLGESVYVAGYTLTGPGFEFADFATVAYDARTGARRWVSLYDGAGGLVVPELPEDMVRALAVSPGGRRVYVTGESSGLKRGAATGYDFATVAYDAVSGEEVWIRRLDVDRGDDIAIDVEAAPDGTAVFVTGWSSPNLTVAYRSRDGERLWRTEHEAMSFDLAVSPNSGNVLITGRSAFGGDLDFETLAFRSASGRVRWAATYDTLGRDEAAAVAVHRSGRVYVAGTSRARLFGRTELVTIAYAST